MEPQGFREPEKHQTEPLGLLQMIRISLALIISFVSLRAAEQWRDTNELIPQIKVRGEIFTNAVLTKVGFTNGILRISSGRLIQIPLTTLPGSLRAKYLDEEALAKYTDELDKTTKALAAARQASINDAQQSYANRVLAEKPLRMIGGKLYDFSLIIETELAILDGRASGVISAILPFAEHWFIGKVSEVHEKGLYVYPQYGSFERVFVKNHDLHKGAHDHMVIRFIGAYAGRFQEFSRTTPIIDCGTPFDKTRHSVKSLIRITLHGPITVEVSNNTPEFPLLLAPKP